MLIFSFKSNFIQKVFFIVLSSWNGGLRRTLIQENFGSLNIAKIEKFEYIVSWGRATFSFSSSYFDPFISLFSPGIKKTSILDFTLLSQI